MKIQVRTPATVANLGPGFDCLGLALDLWNEMEVSTTGDRLMISIEGEGRDVLAVGETNAIYQAMHYFALQQGRALPAGIQIRCQNNIPLGSGLGSSSAATIAGILAAGALLEIADNQEDQLNCAAHLEGHPDNVTPCLLGGFTISLVYDDRVVFRKIPVVPFPLVIVTPAFILPTSQARAALPDNIPHKDAVFNLSRVALLTEAFRNGDFDLLSLATEDRLHQPYRIPLIPGAAAAVSAARDAGALAVTLSGAGPSLLAFLRERSDTGEVGASMIAAFRQVGLRARTLSPSISNIGASVRAV
jgi:homoserine kinase